MKQLGKSIVGDVLSVSNFTSKWDSIRLHPTTFYRRYSEIQEGLSKTSGLYAEMDIGDFILIKFSENSDLNTFYKNFHEYI